MISQDGLDHWNNVVAWDTNIEVEQDLILARFIVEAANDPLLSQAVVLKGGTCLNKIWLDSPWRYSEDLDYQLVHDSNIKEITKAFQEIGEKFGFSRINHDSNVWLSHVFMVDQSLEGDRLRIKVDVQKKPLHPEASVSQEEFQVDNPWFQGKASVLSISPQEILASKVIAIYQRRQPRDLFDIWAALRIELVAAEDIAAAYGRYRPPNPEHWTSRQAARSLIERVNEQEYISNLKYLARHAPVKYDLAQNIHMAVELIDLCAEATQTERSWKRVLKKSSKAQTVMSQWADENPLAAAQIGLSSNALN